MSGAEIFGVIACVASVISAYHNGSEVIRRLKENRAAKRAPPPPRLLEESIDQAPSEIEIERDRGVERFGRAFKVGDQTAIIAIQAITIQLQSSLLEKLRNATSDDDYTDFFCLVDESDQGRNGTKSAMFDLQKRLLVAQRIIELPASTHHHQITVDNVRQKAIRTRTEPTIAPALENDSEDDAAHSQHRHNRNQERRSSMFDLFKRQKPQNRPKTQQAVVEERRKAPLQPSVTPDTRFNQVSRRPKFTYERDEDNPFEIWGCDSAEQEVQRSETTRVPTGLSSAETIVAPSLTGTQRMTKLNFSSDRFPTPDNNYRGFCKGAWKLQNGIRKTMKMRVDYSLSAQSKARLSCVECGFKSGYSEYDFWNKVFTVSSKGVKARYPFLAKSHVPHRQHASSTYLYQCVFCVFMGQEALRVNAKQYLDHIVSEHCGARLSSVVLNRTNCVNDHVCDDDEPFDINLCPVTASEESSLRKSSLGSALSVDLGGLGAGMEHTFTQTA